MPILDTVASGLLAAAIAVLLYVANTGLTLRGRRAGFAKDRAQAKLMPGANSDPVKFTEYLDRKISGLTLQLRLLILPDFLLCVLIALLLTRIFGQYNGGDAKYGLDAWIIVQSLLVAGVLFIFHGLEWVNGWKGPSPKAAEVKQQGTTHAD
jgi:hypothetical protein